MNDSPLSSTSPESVRRKQIAMILAGGCSALLVLAFMFGGKKAPVIQDTEKDIAVGIVDTRLAYQIGGANAPDDWLNAPENPSSDSGATTPPADPDKHQSTVVAGDDASPKTPQTPDGQKGTTPVFPEKPVVTAAGTQAVPTSGSTAAALPKQEPADTHAQKPATQTHAPAAPATKTSSGTVAAAKTPPQKTPAQKGRSPRPGVPIFVKTKEKRPGVLAQSHALITQEDMAATAAQSEPLAKPAPQQQPPKSKPTPARVPQSEARRYAERTTQTFREQGALTPSQRVRLPRSTETTSKKIWREDDKPATPDERRPFGLVVVDEKAAASPSAEIPLRKDIAPGVSPLEKTGADKPLWKRPE